MRDPLREDFHAGTVAHIEKHGRSIIGVFACADDDIPFSYTIGNHLKGLPELLVIGSSRAPYLNDFSRLMIARGGPFANGEVVALPMLTLPMKFIVADTRAHENYTVQAGEYLGHQNYDVLQVLISDREGRFPDQPGCQPPWSTFPVLAAWVM